MFCLKCRYPLKELPDPRCPECGRPFDPLDPSTFHQHEQRFASWRPFICWLIIGPVTGAAVGVAQTSAALLWWLWHDQPDFYFRGWNGVEMTYFFQTVAGGIVGIVFGSVLRLFERLGDRRIRLAISVPATVGVGFLIALLIVEREFRQQTIDPFLWKEMIAVAAGFLIAALFTRPTSAQPPS